VPDNHRIEWCTAFTSPRVCSTPDTNIATARRAARRRYDRFPSFELNMSPWAVALIVAAIIIAGAAFGRDLRLRLPDHHLADETKDMVKIGIAFLTTLAALLLGLILSSAKGSFDSKSEELQAAATKIALLDHSLRQMGPAADPARSTLRVAVAGWEAEVSRSDGAHALPAALREDAQGLKDVRDAIQAITPRDDTQRLAWSKSLQLLDDLEQIRSLAIRQTGSTMTVPLLVLVIFWLTLIAFAMNVFAPRNGTINALNVLSAISAASAIFLILEMDRPFGGLIRVSVAPVHEVLLQLSR
jgi:hypothetical protein